jgi:5-methylcytosine-specific restriction enzyme A
MDRPLTYCVAPGCSVRLVRGYCRQHDAQHTPLAQRWYCTLRWTRLRQQVLVEAVFTCAQCGRIAQDLQVDHIRKHESQPGLFWDRANLQALCLPCHTRKTRRGE